MKTLKVIVIDDYQMHLDVITNCLHSMSEGISGVKVESLLFTDNYDDGKQLILDHYLSIDVAILDFNLDESETRTAFQLLKEILREKKDRWEELPFKVMLISADDFPLRRWEVHPEARKVLRGTMLKWPENPEKEFANCLSNLEDPIKKSDPLPLF